MEYVYKKERFQKALYNIFSKYAKSVSIDFSRGKDFSSEELSNAGFLPEEFSPEQKLEASRIFNDCVEGLQSFEEFVKFMEFSSKGIKSRGDDAFAKILSEEVLNRPNMFEGEVSFEDICSIFEDKSLSTYRPLIKKIDKQAKLASKGKINKEEYINPKTFLRLVSSACDVNNAFAETWDNDSVFKSARENGMFNYNYVTESYIDQDMAVKLSNIGYSNEVFAKIDADIEKCATKHDFRLGKTNPNDKISFRERSEYRKKDFQTNFIPSTAKTYDELVKVFQSNLLAPYAMGEASDDDVQDSIENLQLQNNIDAKLTGLNKDNIDRAIEYGKAIKDAVKSLITKTNMEVDSNELVRVVSNEFASRGGFVMDKVDAYTTLAECAMSDEVLNEIPYSEVMFRAYAPKVQEDDNLEIFENDAELPMERRRFVGSGFVKKDGILFPVDNLPISKKANAEAGDNVQYELNISFDSKEFDSLKEEWEKKYSTSFENVERNDVYFGKNPLASTFANLSIQEYIEKNKPDMNVGEVKDAIKEQLEVEFDYKKSQKEEKTEESSAKKVETENKPETKEQDEQAKEEDSERKPLSCKDALTVRQAYAVLIEALIQVAEQLQNEGFDSEKDLFDSVDKSFEKIEKITQEAEEIANEIEQAAEGSKEEDVVVNGEDNSQEQSTEAVNEQEEEQQPTEDKIQNEESATAEEIQSTEEKIEEITEETKKIINKYAFKIVADNERGLFAVPNYRMIFDEQMGRIIPMADGQTLEEAREAFIKNQESREDISSTTTEENLESVEKEEDAVVNGDIKSEEESISEVSSDTTIEDKSATVEKNEEKSEKESSKRTLGSTAEERPTIKNKQTVENNSTIIKDTTKTEISNTLVQSQTTKIIINKEVQENTDVNPLDTNNVSKLISAAVKLGYISREEAKEYRKTLKDSKQSVLLEVKTAISKKVNDKQEDNTSTKEVIESVNEETKEEKQKEPSQKASDIADKIIANGGKRKDKKERKTKSKPVEDLEVKSEENPATNIGKKPIIVAESKPKVERKPVAKKSETAEKAEAERLAKLEEQRKAEEARKAEIEMLARERAEKAETERKAREKAEEEKRIAKEKAEKERKLAYEKAVAEDRAYWGKVIASRPQIKKMIACRKYEDFLALAKETTLFDETELAFLCDKNNSYNDKQHYMKAELKVKLGELLNGAQEYEDNAVAKESDGSVSYKGKYITHREYYNTCDEDEVDCGYDPDIDGEEVDVSDDEEQDAGMGHK